MLVFSGQYLPQSSLLRPQGHWGSRTSTPVGAFAPNSKFDASVIYKAVLSCLRCAITLAAAIKESLFIDAINLAHAVSSDAGAVRNGGMTAQRLRSRPHQIWGLGRKPQRRGRQGLAAAPARRARGRAALAHASNKVNHPQSARRAALAAAPPPTAQAPFHVPICYTFKTQQRK